MALINSSYYLISESITLFLMPMVILFICLISYRWIFSSLRICVFYSYKYISSDFFCILLDQLISEALHLLSHSVLNSYFIERISFLDQRFNHHPLYMFRLLAFLDVIRFSNINWRIELINRSKIAWGRL